ncbi:YIP1 family protein [Paracoccus xiamenensis]|uniref:YIP1 family protein n=1 Tax=Paracoccus xiamenensis TaxID=2714901 RepID=UPI00140C8B27|nr:YIP1 family protein [Paracoccus xiamenensis]NHF74100.1 YIP1 family protein [Paracoccus xiamenensis]
MRLNDLLILTQNSVRNPALAVRQLQSLDLPMQARWMALLVVVALSAILGTLAVRLFPALADGGLSIPVLSPMARVALQTAGMVLTAWLIATVGRSFGGVGDFPDALLIVIWLEFLLMSAQAAQIVLMLVFPFLGSILGIVALVLVVWLSVQMIKALHGFSSAALVFLGLLGATLVTLIFLTVMAGALGLMPELPAEVSP